MVSCGECPVCGGGGDLCVVRALQIDVTFVWCPSCGCAWPFRTNRVDTIDGPKRYAPDGFRPATRAEAMHAGYVEEDLVETDTWDDYIEEQNAYAKLVPKR